MTVHLVNPSHLSFGVGVITPRWLFVLGAATPLAYGQPRIVDETLEPLDFDTVHAGDMLFSAGEVISDISRTNTLSPGDVVWLGTDELPQSIGPGDTIEIEISGIGVLRNRVVAAT